MENLVQYKNIVSLNVFRVSYRWKWYFLLFTKKLRSEILFLMLHGTESNRIHSRFDKEAIVQPVWQPSKCNRWFFLSKNFFFTFIKVELIWLYVNSDYLLLSNWILKFIYFHKILKVNMLINVNWLYS